MDSRNPGLHLEGLKKAYLRRREEILLPLAHPLQTQVAQFLFSHRIRCSSLLPDVRVKEVDSFLEKALVRKAEKYQDPIAEITDQLALRIIVFYMQDIARVRDALSMFFEVLEESDRSFSPIIDANEMNVGYRSYHMVIRTCHRQQKTSWIPGFEPEVVEVQIRTILQHAWAEIEHPLKYKASGRISDVVRRRLLMLSAMLELGDFEFAEIRERVEFEKARELERVKLGDFDFPIEDHALATYIMHSSTFESIYDIAKKYRFICWEWNTAEGSTLSQMVLAFKGTRWRTIREIDGPILKAVENGQISQYLEQIALLQKMRMPQTSESRPFYFGVWDLAKWVVQGVFAMDFDKRFTFGVDPLVPQLSQAIKEIFGLQTDSSSPTGDD